MDNYHPNINLTIKINPKTFLDTQVITKNGKIETAVYRKSTKQPVPWSPNIPKRYKRNAANANLIVLNEFLQTLISKFSELKEVFSSTLSTNICGKSHS